MKAPTAARKAFALMLLVGVASAVAAHEPAERLARGSGRSVDPGTLSAAQSVADEAAEMDAIRERIATFGDWFQRAMDLECSGRVPVVRLVEITDTPRDSPTRMDWTLALDVDDDGFVEPGEVGEGIWEEHLGYQVGRPMQGDIDGDGVLSPREFALTVPDPGAATNLDRLSNLQEARFATFDRNDDRRVSPYELADYHERRGLALYWSRMLLFHLDRADSDEDGAVTREELTSAIEAASGVVTPPALDVWFQAVWDGTGEASVPQLVLAELPTLLRAFGATADGRAKFQAPLAPLLAPACGTR